MIWTKIIDVQKEPLVLNLPHTFRSKKVRVIVEDISEAWAKKIQQMQLSQNDPLFQADLDEVQADFKRTDNELL